MNRCDVPPIESSAPIKHGSGKDRPRVKARGSRHAGRWRVKTLARVALCGT